jgi:hypothetical protein
MANVQKYTRTAIGHLTKHYERGLGSDGELVRFGNQDIKTNESYKNYNLAPDRGMSQIEYINKRIGEVQCLERKDINVMCSWVVTLPKDGYTMQEQQEDFFKCTYDFLAARYGGKNAENVVSAYVHCDENQPHMHFTFVPITKDKKKGHLKVSAKEVLTRVDLQRFHSDLEKHLEAQLLLPVRPIGILNDATRWGNRAIKDLKRDSAHDKVNEIESKVATLNVEYEAKKAYVEQAIENSNLSMEIPDYAKVKTKGIFKKQEFVVVPRDKWEDKWVSVSDRYAVERAQQAFENAVKKLEDTPLSNEIKVLKKSVRLLEVGVHQLKFDRSKLKNEVKELKSDLNVKTIFNDILLDFIRSKNLFVEFNETLEKRKRKIREEQEKKKGEGELQKNKKDPSAQEKASEGDAPKKKKSKGKDR